MSNSRIGKKPKLVRSLKLRHVTFIGVALNYVDARPRTVTTIPVSSYPSTTRNDFQMEPVGTSSVNNYSHAKPKVTNSFDLSPTTSTFKTDSIPAKQQAADDNFVTNGPPSYSSLYS